MSFDSKLIKAFGQEKAEKIRALLDDPESTHNYKSANEFYNSCYNKPSIGLVCLYAINEILDGYGIEGISDPENSCDGFDYVNMGDTYATSVTLFDGKFHVESYGDRIEKLGW